MIKLEKELPLVRALFNGQIESLSKHKNKLDYNIFSAISISSDPLNAVKNELDKIKHIIILLELCVLHLDLSESERDLILHNIYVDFDECVIKCDEYTKIILDIVNKKIPARINAIPRIKEPVNLNNVSPRNKRIALVIFVKEQYNFNLKTTGKWLNMPISTVGKYRQTYLKMTPDNKAIVDEVIKEIKKSCQNIDELLKFISDWFKS